MATLRHHIILLLTSWMMVLAGASLSSAQVQEYVVIRSGDQLQKGQDRTWVTTLAAQGIELQVSDKAIPITVDNKAHYIELWSVNKPFDAEVSQRLLRDNIVIVIEPNSKLSIDNHSYTDTYFDSLWYVTRLRIPEAHHITQGSADILVAVIDTGIHFEHEDLQGAFWINTAESEDETSDADNNGYTGDRFGYNFLRDSVPGRIGEGTAIPRDDNGHGTAMASIIASRRNAVGTVGIAPNVTIMPLKAFDKDGFATQFDIARAILYAVDNGAKVINMSFGDAFRSAVQELAVTYAYERGVIMVSSAGNMGGPNPRYPAAFPQTIAVSWSTQQDIISTRGNYGAHVDVAAPGSAIWSAQWINNAFTNTYGSGSGSSASAALVSGLSALMLSQDGGLTPEMVRHRLKSGADDIMMEGHDQLTGAGRINAVMSLLSEQEAFLHIDSLQNSQNGAALRLYGSAIGKEINEVEVLVAAGWREPLQFQSIQIVKRRFYHEEMLEFAWTLNGQYTFALRSLTSEGKRIESRKSITIQRESPELTEVFSARGVHYDVPFLATYVTSSQLVNWKFSSMNALLSLDQKQATRNLILRDATLQEPSLVTVRNDIGVAETIQISTPSQNSAWFEWKGSVGINYTEPAVQSSFYTALDWTLFNKPSGSFLSREQTQNGIGLVYRSFENGTWQQKGTLFTSFFPRDIGDVHGDGRPEVLLQFGNRFTLATELESDEFPLRLLNNSQTYEGWGSVLADVEGIGRKEVWAHFTTQWRRFRVNGSQVQEVQTLTNPSTVRPGVISGGNQFQRPIAAVLDVDDDGLEDVITGDFDGDIIIYGKMSSGEVGAKFIFSTGLYGAGQSIVAIHDETFKGFAYLVHPFPGIDDAGNVERPFLQLRLYRIESGVPVPADTLVISEHNPELARLVVLGTPQKRSLLLNVEPYQYFVSIENGKMHLKEVAISNVMGEPGYVTLSNEQIPVFATGNGTMTYRSKTLVNGSTYTWPVFRLPVYSDEVFNVRFQAPTQADSVQVFVYQQHQLVHQQTIEQPGFQLQTSVPFQLQQPTTQLQVTLKAWRNTFLVADSTRVFSEIRPFAVEQVVQASPEQLVFFASDAIDPSTLETETLAEQLNSTVAQVVTPAHNALIIHFSRPISSVSSISLPFLKNLEGSINTTPEVSISRSLSGQSRFYIVGAEVVDARNLKVNMSQDIDLSSLGQTSVTIAPLGMVTQVSATGSVLELSVSQTDLITNGIAHEIQIRQLHSVQAEPIDTLVGNRLKVEVMFDDFGAIKAYPNPYSIHRDATLTFGGIPSGAEITILTPDGKLITKLTTKEGASGLSWDGRDASGRLIGSGVYLYRVSLSGKHSSFEKLVVIR